MVGNAEVILVARMKISIYAPHAKERFEIAPQNSILHLNESLATRKLSSERTVSSRPAKS